MSTPANGPGPEDVIRSAARHPYAPQRALEALEADTVRWTTELQAAMTTWAADTMAAIKAAVDSQAVVVLVLEERVTELEGRARRQDDDDAELRDRG